MTIMKPFMIYADFECYNGKIKRDIYFDGNKSYTLLKAEKFHTVLQYIHIFFMIKQKIN